MRRVIIALVVVGSLVAAGAGLAAAQGWTTYPVKVERKSTTPGANLKLGVDGVRLTLAN